MTQLVEKRRKQTLQMLRAESIKVDWHDLVEPGKRIDCQEGIYESKEWSLMVKCRPSRKWVVRIYSLGV